MSKIIWGIDISKTSVKATKMATIKNVPRVLDIAVMPYKFGKKKITEQEQNALYLQTLEALKKSAKIGRDPVFISLPTHAVFNRIIKVPVDFNDPKFDQIVSYETASQIPFPMDQVIWHYLKVEREYLSDEDKEIVILAVKKDVINNFLDIISAANLNIQGIQISPLALYNFLQFDQGIEEPTLVFDMGADNASLMISENGRIWIRNIPITGNDITAAIQEKLNTSFENAEKLKISCAVKPDRNIYEIMQGVYKNIVAEVHRSLGFYKTFSRDLTFNKMILLGQASKAFRLQQFLSQSLQMNVTKILRIHNIEVSSSVAEEILGDNIHSLGVSLGLALEGLNLTYHKANLIPPEIEQIKQVKRQKPWYIAAGALFMIFALLFYAVLSSKKSRLKNEIDQISEINKELKSNKNQIAQIKKELAEFSGTAAKLYSLSKEKKRGAELFLQTLGKISETSSNERFDKRLWLLSSSYITRYKANPNSNTQLDESKIISMTLEVAISRYEGKELKTIVDPETLQTRGGAKWIPSTDVQEYIQSLFQNMQIKELILQVIPNGNKALPAVGSVPDSWLRDVKSIPQDLFYVFKIDLEISI